MNIKRKYWSEEEKKKLEELYKINSVTELILILLRTRSSIVSMIFELGLTKHNPVKINQKFNRLLTIENLGIQKGITYFKCICDCGNIINMSGNRLNSGHTQSCGCLSTEVKSNRWKKTPGEAAWHRFFQSYKRGAKDRNYEFNLTFDQFKHITQQNCYYTNRPPKRFNPYLNKNNQPYNKYLNKIPETVERAWIKVNGIDRKDNSKGYTLDNCVPCASDINWAKRAMNDKEFIQMAYEIVKHRESIKK